MKELAGKVAFVTGGASGIGLAIARSLSAAGMKVAIADIEGTALDQVTEEHAASAAEMIHLQVDVTDRDAMEQAARQVEAAFGIRLARLSAMNSSGLELLEASGMPARVNHARIGEAILLGRETTRRRPWPGTYQDAFVLHVEVLECRRKPSAVSGQHGQDAFGDPPAQALRGEVVAIGMESWV